MAEKMVGWRRKTWKTLWENHGKTMENELWKNKGHFKNHGKKLTWKNTSSPQRKLCTMSTKEICGGANSVNLKSSDSKGGDSPLIEQHFSSFYEQYHTCCFYGIKCLTPYWQEGMHYLNQIWSNIRVAARMCLAWKMRFCGQRIGIWPREKCDLTRKTGLCPESSSENHFENPSEMCFLEHHI